MPHISSKVERHYSASTNLVEPLRRAAGHATACANALEVCAIEGGRIDPELVRLNAKLIRDISDALLPVIQQALEFEVGYEPIPPYPTGGDY